MKWSARFETGVEEIDRQHQLLFQMSEHYREALDAGEGGAVYGLLLESLADYARGHFGMEEQCMHRYRCPAAETNAAAHGRFMATLQRYQERYAAGGFNRSDARELLDYIDTWLSSHIARVDRQLKPCVEASGRNDA